MTSHAGKEGGIFIMCWEKVRLRTVRKNIDPGHIALEVGGMVYGFFPEPGYNPEDCPGMMLKQSRNEFIGYLVTKIRARKREFPRASQEQVVMKMHFFSVKTPRKVTQALAQECNQYYRRCQVPNLAHRPRYRLRNRNCIQVTAELLTSVGAFDFSGMRPIMTPDSFRKRVLEPKINHRTVTEKAMVIKDDPWIVRVDP